MHEMGIAAQIIEIVKSSIPDNITDPCVECVNVRAGKLSAIVTDSLHFCFEIASKETLLEGAILNIEEVPVRASCKSCQHEWIINDAVFICPDCGAKVMDILSGRELDVVSIELAD